MPTRCQSVLAREAANHPVNTDLHSVGQGGGKPDTVLSHGKATQVPLGG
jgi:hypothetical protein